VFKLERIFISAWCPKNCWSHRRKIETTGDRQPIGLADICRI